MVLQNWKLEKLKNIRIRSELKGCWLNFVNASLVNEALPEFWNSGRAGKARLKKGK